MGNLSSPPIRRGERGVANSHENLALLYQGLFTVIVRLQSGRQELPEPESFRRRTKATLEEIERLAAAGYENADVRGTHFAVVAFLDSVILHSSGPAAMEWKRKTLQEELFGQTDAGVVFFEKLEQFSTRGDSPQLADLLEVFLLCLLLGFEGRYSGGFKSDLDVIVERLRVRIEQIRGRGAALSPHGSLPAADMTPAVTLAPARDFRLAALAAAILALICFLLFSWNLASLSEQVRATLL
jgi:type VI secretion system protein ImpK